mmetsp:Transcript_33683/g.81581  ORF Transcript_33683/g.81581 Transcript_33683/m.81581 type:complete len:117 (+) Transcript_33683:288-638(+)
MTKARSTCPKSKWESAVDRQSRFLYGMSKPANKSFNTMKSTHKIKDQKDQPVRAKCQGALRGYMLDGALTWSDRDYVFSNVPPSLVGSVHLRLKHHSYKRGAVPVKEVEEPLCLLY